MNSRLVQKTIVSHDVRLISGVVIDVVVTIRMEIVWVIVFVVSSCAVISDICVNFFSVIYYHISIFWGIKNTLWDKYVKKRVYNSLKSF